eukprot:TRINITY_DN4145_c0_g1_i1.p2 TRINITY_DN4145_c0_g1~~TRINITY_DN4145_c0_g1_i1.p2  ORF type:complete len:298 (-),score=-26.41 TRINITY_DN4145_c0_g1_i1:1412-2305(-)
MGAHPIDAARRGAPTRAVPARREPDRCGDDGVAVRGHGPAPDARRMGGAGRDRRGRRGGAATRHPPSRRRLRHPGRPAFDRDRRRRPRRGLVDPLSGLQCPPEWQQRLCPVDDPVCADDRRRRRHGTAGTRHHRLRRWPGRRRDGQAGVDAELCSRFRHVAVHRDADLHLPQSRALPGGDPGQSDGARRTRRDRQPVAARVRGNERRLAVGNRCRAPRRQGIAAFRLCLRPRSRRDRRHAVPAGPRGTDVGIGQLFGRVAQPRRAAEDARKLPRPTSAGGRRRRGTLVGTGRESPFR